MAMHMVALKITATKLPLPYVTPSILAATTPLADLWSTFYGPLFGQQQIKCIIITK
jgi:hypothetical protein